MPFEPRIAHHDDEAAQAARAAVCEESQCDLPADLAELARQLLDDAERIDACQAPAERAALPAPPRAPRRWGRGAWAATAAAALLAAGVTLWHAGIGGSVAHSTTGPVAANRRAAAPAPVAEPRAEAPGPPAVTEIALPASVFSQLSGAEQDGMSDLLEGVPCRVELP